MKLLFVFDTIDHHKNRRVVLVNADSKAEAFRTLVVEYASLHLDSTISITYRSVFTLSRMANTTKPDIEGSFS